MLPEAGRAAESEYHLRRGLSIRELIMPDTHWLLANTRAMLGASLTAQNRFDEAERLLIPADQTLVDQVGASHEMTERARNWIRELYERWGRPETAESLFGDVSRRATAETRS